MKAGFTLGSAMSSARSFSVRVMRQQLKDRAQACRVLALRFENQDYFF
jgi:hypothetical protein